MSEKTCMLCANCGEIGHYHKDCSKPITSLGIILFNRDNDTKILNI